MNPSETMNHLRKKLPLPIIITTICILLFTIVLYAERLSFLSSTSIFKFKTCPRKHTRSKSYDRKIEHVVVNGTWIDDRFDFDPEECNVAHGKWIFNHSIKPLYSDTSCPYIDKQFSCVKNGRNDSHYLHWEWQPEDCTLPQCQYFTADLPFFGIELFVWLPNLNHIMMDYCIFGRFNPEVALKKLKGKRLLFVGDSLQRNQWQSFVCLVQGIIPQKKKSMKRGRVHSVFKAKEYNASIEFYWAPFLVESNTDINIIGDPKKRIIKVDEISERAKNWTGVHILVFNSYVWWMSGLRVKALWGSFSNGEDGYEELDTSIAYNLGLRTWANWVDSTINPNKTRVFFTTMSPAHTKSADWGNKDGTKCFNETKPVKKKNHWGSGSNKGMMSVVAKVIKTMKVPVTVINITQISEYRIDGHSSVYTETGGKLLTEDERRNPLNADCIHWCLPGVPDTWNQIFFAML